MKLNNYCRYNTERIPVDFIDNQNYISTENMLPNREGITNASNIPLMGDVTCYKKGDILISNIRPYFKKIWHANHGGGCSADVLCIRANENISSDYLYYLLSQQIFFDFVMAGAKGCKMPRGDKQHIMQWNVEIPNSKQQQEHIASILRSLDNKIELNNRMNKNLEEQAQALFKLWFVDEKKYDTIELGTVVKTTSGGTPSRSNLSYYQKGIIKWVKSKELNGSFITQTEEHITFDAVEKSSAKLLPKNSVLIAMYGATVGEHAIISEEMTCNQAVCALLPNEKYPASFLFMLAKNAKEELINLAVGSAQQNISQILIKRIQVPTCVELIQKYDKLISPYLEIMKNNIKQNLNLAQLRDALLPRLMNGDAGI